MKIRLKLAHQTLIIYHYTAKGEIKPYSHGAKLMLQQMYVKAGYQIFSAKMERMLREHYKGKGVQFWIYNGQSYTQWDELAKLLVEENKAELVF